MGLLWTVFTMLRYVPNNPSPPKTFIMKVYWICQRPFLYLLGWSNVLCSLGDYIYWLKYVEPSLPLWDEVYLILVDKLFFWDRVLCSLNCPGLDLRDSPVSAFWVLQLKAYATNIQLGIFLNSFCKYFIKILAFMFVRDNDLYFFVESLYGFGIRVIITSKIPN